jgi:hypothetical protein
MAGEIIKLVSVLLDGQRQLLQGHLAAVSRALRSRSRVAQCLLSASAAGLLVKYWEKKHVEQSPQEKVPHLLLPICFQLPSGLLCCLLLSRLLRLVCCHISGCCSKVGSLGCCCCLPCAIMFLHLQVKLLLLLLLHLLPHRMTHCNLHSK